MKSVLPVYKPVGLSPLQTIYKLKSKFPEYKDQKISYAGRLDPMAEGLLLLLIGDENRNRRHYEDLPKTYEFTVLLGLETDTYDVLGKVNKIPIQQYDNLQLFDIEHLKFDILNSFLGERIQVYPPYSSKAVQGKPLYWWARQGRLHEITIPAKAIEIYSIELVKKDTIKIQDLRFMIQEKIQKVNGDFRQKEIVADWKNFFNENIYSSSKEQNDESRSSSTEADTSSRLSSFARTITSFPSLQCRVTCSSGTYVRSIAHELGKKLGTGGIALMIKRTEIGDYSLKDALTL